LSFVIPGLAEGQSPESITTNLSIMATLRELLDVLWLWIPGSSPWRVADARERADGSAPE
jgi:hypothetical protein